MKKIFKLFRNIIVMILWSLVFVYITNTLYIKLWNFDYTHTTSWQIMSDYWNSGGVIESTSDIILVSALILLPVLWFWGYIKALKLNYTVLVLKPISLVYDVINRSSDNSERIVIRNIKSNAQRAEEIKNELSSLKPQKPKETNTIRQNLQEKVTNGLKK